MTRPRQRSAFTDEVLAERGRVQHAASGLVGRRWLPAAAAASLVVGVIGVGMSSGSADRKVASPTKVPSTLPVEVLDTLAPAQGTQDLEAPVETQPSVQITEAPGPPKTKLRRALKIKSTGREVAALQARLRELGFKPDDKKGVFGPLTRASVWAFEKLVLGTPALKAKGVVTNELWQVMQDDILISPRRTQTTKVHAEIYLPQQVVIIFSGDKAVFISHISSGKVDKNGQPALYREVLRRVDTDQAGNPLPVPKPEVAVMAYSKTPGGVFRVRRKSEGVHKGRLGGMLNPVFFNYGIAMHGGYRVPLTRESHGCVRVPNPVSHYLIELLNRGDQVFVWDGKKEPEKQTRAESMPSFNRLDPSVPTTVDLPPASTLPPRPTRTTTKATVKTTTKPTVKTTTKPTVKRTTTTVKRATTTVAKPTTSAA